MLSVLRNGSASPVKGTQVNRLFERFFDEAFLAPAAYSPHATRPMAAWEDAQSYHIEVDVPGIAEGDIELSAHDGELFIRGARKPASAESRFDNRAYGPFEQRVTLPGAVDADRVTAKLNQGVLAITLPKTEAAKPRKIAING